MNEALGGDDFAIDEFPPHHFAVRGLHAVVEDAARAEIDLARQHLESLGSPPVLQVLALGERFPHETAWRIEDARDDERVLRRAPGGARAWAAARGHLSLLRVALIKTERSGFL